MRNACRHRSIVRTAIRLRVFAVAALVTSWCSVCAQVITTVAGTGFSFPSTPLAAINAPVGAIFGMAVDTHGNVYLADPGNNQVFKVDRNGTLTVAAGNGIPGFTGDGGPATSAALNTPLCVAVDISGNLYIADYYNNRVRKVTASGTISTVAGNGVQGYAGDHGPALNAKLSLPVGVAVDSAGDLFIGDSLNQVIRKVTPDGIIITVAGNTNEKYSGDGGPAIDAALNLGRLGGPGGGVAVDASGNLFIADTFNSRIRKVTPAGIISTVAGDGAFTHAGDGGQAIRAALNSPLNVALDASGNLFIADFENSRIRKVTPAGIISTVAGSGGQGYCCDHGPAVGAKLSLPTGVAVDSVGNLFIADSGNRRVRTVTSDGVIRPLVGNGAFQFAGDGGQGADAVLNSPASVALDRSGNLFIADSGNNRIRKLTTSETIETVVGNGALGYSGDQGPAAKAELSAPSGVAFDASGNLFIADKGNNAIRQVTSAGIIGTVAGNTMNNFSGDGGPAIKAALRFPLGVVPDGAGNLFIADTFNSRIRQVTPSGMIETIAGTQAARYSGDNGPAAKADLNTPSGVAVDAAGDLFIADTNNNAIRRISGGIITTMAGNGKPGYTGDGGPATNAQLNAPAGVEVDADGNLFIADTGNNAIREVSGGNIFTVAGNGTHGFAGDGGPATAAVLNRPSSVAVDVSHNLFIADKSNNRIREVLATTPSVGLSPGQLQFTASSGGAPTTAQTLTLISHVEGLAYSVSLPDGVSWLQVDPPSGASPRLIQVIADPADLPPDTYKTTITFDIRNASPSSISVPVSFAVTAGQAPTLSVDKTNLSFPFPQHGSARSQTFTVSNSGGSTLDFKAGATNAPWLKVFPPSGSALPAAPVLVTVTANPSGLASGTYTGQVVITAGTQSQKIAVTLIISEQDQAILLSQTGLSFVGVSQGGVLPPQNFSVLNIGTGAMSWNASITPPSATWLHVPAGGSTDAVSGVSTVPVMVDAASLSKGTYYGLVRVDAPGAANTPQVLTVVAQVLGPGSDPGAVIQPAELLFTATVGGESPGSQTLSVYNVAAAAKTFHAAPDKVLNVAILPSDVTLNRRQPSQVVVQPFTTGLAAGVHTSAIPFQFSDGRVLSANIHVIVAASGGNSGSVTVEEGQSVMKPDASAPCAPKKLVLGLNTLAQSSTVPAGYPVGLEVNVKDDCGSALTAGSVTAAFSNGDQELQLHSLKNGFWNATWQTSSTSASSVTITLQASDSQARLRGKSVVNTALAATTNQPVFALEHIVSAAGGQAFVPVAPGSLISITGKNLAEAAASPTTQPLPIQLGGTVVEMAGLALPLYSTSDGQIGAQVPFEVKPNVVSYLVVSHGGAYSQPVGVDVAAAQPAIYTDTKVASNQGRINVVRGTQQFEATPNTPASPGDSIVIYCEGLGAVKPPAASGALGSGQSTMNTPKVAIGGVQATVKSSELAPGSVGMYQVKAVVPENVPKGSAVSVAITIAGQTSPEVVMAIQ